MTARISFLFLILFVTGCCTVQAEPLPNYGIVLPGSFTRSGQPDKLGFSKLKKSRVDVIFKLNTDSEYPASQEKREFGGKVVVRHVEITKANCKEYKSVATEIQTYLQSGRRVHVHCTKGRDRTGGVVGVWRVLYGNWTYKQARDEMSKYGVRGGVAVVDSKIISCVKGFSKK